MMQGEVRRLTFEQRGQVLPLVLLSLTVILAFLALTVDVGFWRYQQRLEQTAADSAAVAGALYRQNYSTELDDIKTVAKKDATSNGFTDDNGVTTNITVHNPPSTGSYTGDSTAVEVVVQKKQPVFFAGIFKPSAQWVSARSVARYIAAPPNDCIVGLSTTGTAVLISGASNVKLGHCAIIANSDLNISGTNSGSPVTAYAITYAGSNRGDSNANNFLINGAHVSPSHGSVAADPCSSITTCAGLTNSPPAATTCASQTSWSGQATVNIPAGTYCSQLVVQGAQTITFATGFYYLEAGMLISGAQTVTGNAVTFYNSSGVFQFQGSNFTVTAPTSGTYSGILMYQPASNTSEAQISGAQTAVFGGMLYAPKAMILESGSIASTVSVVANYVQFTGSPIGDNAGTTTGLGGTSRVSLAE